MSARTLVGAVILAAVAVVAAPALAQEPTLHEVYQAADSGNLVQAQRMMSEVLRAHPNSGKAHYVEAELLTKQGQLSAAAAELSTAERLDPGLPFAKPEAVRELKARIASPRSFGMSTTSGSSAPAGGSGTPWGGLLLGAAVLAVIALAIGAVMNRRNAAGVTAGSVQPYNPNAAMQPPGTGAPATGSPASGGIGSAILGGLATGAAVGAGMVAGEALANRLMGHHGEGSVQPPLGGDLQQSDMGGTDFGVADSSSWDDGLGGIGGDGGSDWS